MLGCTAIVAANYANSFSDYDYNASIKAFRIYGNATIQIKKTRNSLTAVSNESTVSKDLSTSNISVNTNELYPALSAIKEINPAFSSSNYKVTVVKTDDVAENYTIDYMLMDGDFVTSSGYSIIVENGKAIRVQDNSIISTKHQYSSAKNTTKITDSIINAAFSSAELHAKSINDGNVVTKQRGEAYLDIETGEHYYRVFTVYEASTGGFGAFSYLYPLD